MEGEREGWFTARWRWWVLLLWIGMSAFLLWQRRTGIEWFALGDTDDNMRIMQVRALLDGQGWYDLRQHRLNPPYGADIHWSRIVDLPIAGIKLILAPLLGGATAERAAVAAAPLLPMLVGMFACAVTARRLISPKAFLLGAALLVCGHSVRGMWSPLRIDHHGWQLALLALVVMGLADRKAARGGLTIGIASALSLAIGLEMLLYLALTGVAVGLFWVRDRAEAPRLEAYGISLAGGCALFFLLFTSYANSAPVCDALSPVWLSVMIVAGALALLLARLSPPSHWLRLAAAIIAGLGVAAVYAVAWPHCLGRLEGASPELEQMWLSRVREAMPVYRHSWRVIVAVLTLPVIGIVGYAVMLWRSRRQADQWPRWAALGALALLAASLLLWQTRAGPAAQLLSVPGAAGLAWVAIVWLQSRASMAVRVLGTAGAVLLFSGLFTQYASSLVPDKPATKGRKLVNEANRKCPTLPALRPIALQPKGVVLTHVDLGPRLIAVTHHDAIAGPYHRNGADILAVMRAFRGTADDALRTVRARRVDYVLICPNISESTVYRADAPKGFYVQLASGKVPQWLDPIALPADSPYRMWRIRR